ncbi:MAG: hypothetical protein IPI00_01305 [Flavobacteriales bacterium]|nr:hypothetical protein [Flavobacteriales bacterium]MBK6946224.1 hypothetical protein [Flavobacteriales bacterium]MBK7238824.1 hypothetical protein [Flavobacteriales bacterium]MBK9537051.1 hypothetical protein [Flavobacteriales bacterium]MBP9139719.1 hypothetical protein [Flavobacteriales bacterium]
MKTILAILTSLIFVSCAQKNSAPLEVEKEKETAPTEIHEKNRTIGVIQQAITKEGCAWTIRIKEVDYLLDPTNLGEEFMVNELRVRFDYLPLRMVNRCKEANPIEVLSMVKMK